MSCVCCFSLCLSIQALIRLLAQRKPEATPFAYILPSDDIQLAKDLFTPVFEALAADPNVEVDWEYVESKTWFELWSGGQSRGNPPFFPKAG